MKDEKLEMTREVWEYFRQYRQAPIKKKYSERVRFRELFEINKQKEKRFFS
jgi:hypothetical protein